YVAVRRVPSVPSQDRTATLAKGGDAQAQLQVGLGDLAKNDTTDAAPWLERAAIQGVPVAQYRVATLYAAGRGVPAGKVNAYRWYVIAAKAGRKESKERVDARSSQLTSEDRSAAETAAAEFKPLPMNARANEPQ